LEDAIVPGGGGQQQQQQQQEQHKQHKQEKEKEKQQVLHEIETAERQRILREASLALISMGAHLAARSPTR
jgi:hypothetical protein